MLKYRMKRHAVTQPLDPSYRLIPLTQGQNAIVDTDDYDWLNQWNWCISYFNNRKFFYVRRSGDGVYMHRLIMGPNADHKNRNPLDNRRQNLRKCTRNQNMRNRRPNHDNTSGFKGVSWNTRLHKWVAKIAVDRTERYLGLFSSAEEAAHTYDEAAKKYHGEFAYLNFPSR